MVPRSNICQVAGGGCTRQSSYGLDGGKPVVCTVHRQPGMVQVSDFCHIGVTLILTKRYIIGLEWEKQYVKLVDQQIG